MQIKEKGTQIEPEIRTLKDLSYRNDENNVDIDVETAKMAKNKIYYDALGQSMSNEIRLLRMAITGRG
jgi:flagellar basal-body rod protein FlgB